VRDKLLKRCSKAVGGYKVSKNQYIIALRDVWEAVEYVVEEKMTDLAVESTNRRC